MASCAENDTERTKISGAVLGLNGGKFKIATGMSEIEIITIILQIVGVILLVTSSAMFLKHGFLQKRENTYQICVLVSNAMLLLFDWSVFKTGYTRCDVFSMTFLVFGSASTLSSLAIAWDRFRRMSRLLDSAPRKTQYIVGIMVIWLLSLSTMVLPLYGVIHSHRDRPRKSADVLCFFKDGVLHSTFGPSLYFALVSAILPTFGMLVFYIGIYKSVKTARISRWINQASVAASRKAVVLKSNGRKANIIALPTPPPIQRSDSSASKTTSQIQQQSHRDTQVTSLRERSILLKGILSVLLVLFWYPFTGIWLMTSINELRPHHVHYLRWFILLAKLSAVLRILHYVVLNTKYRRFYFQMICKPFKNRVHVIHSRIESNNDTDNSRLNRPSIAKEASEKAISAKKANLETIAEIQQISSLAKY